MRYLQVLLAFALFFPISSASLHAQEWNEGDYEEDLWYPKNKIALYGGLSLEKVAEFRVDYHYMITPFFGFGGGLFLNKAFWQEAPCGKLLRTPTGYEWKSLTAVSKAGAVLSALVKISFLKHLSVEIEPGWLFAIPKETQRISINQPTDGITGFDRVSATGGQWNSWQVRAGLNWNFDGGISLGASYFISGLDTFSTARLLEYQEVKFDRFYPEKKAASHSFTLNVAFCF